MDFDKNQHITFSVCRVTTRCAVKGAVRIDGRKMHDMYLFEVKKPAKSKYPDDLYKLRATIPAEEAFRPLRDGGCRWSMVKSIFSMVSC
jgi:hypothetical protein